jgi:2-polyprenyl-3-methyl-5-hydroxy-6-metoxy-1,4-benzoquinol methylase
MKASLTLRQQTEKDFHNRKFSGGNTPSGDYRVNSEVYNFYWGLVGNVEHLKVLDLGCGNGWLSILLAKSGARVWGIDISDELVKIATRAAESERLSEKVTFKEMSCENMAFDDESFDLIIGSSVLHHTELSESIKGIKRTLKPGGRAIFMEPLNENIFLKLWRRLTPWRRSPTERALVKSDLKDILEAFPKADCRFFVLTAIFTEGLLILSPKSRLLNSVNTLMQRLDRLLLKAFPPLNHYCAVVVFNLVK